MANLYFKNDESLVNIAHSAAIFFSETRGIDPTQAFTDLLHAAVLVYLQTAHPDARNIAELQHVLSKLNAEFIPRVFANWQIEKAAEFHGVGHG